MVRRSFSSLRGVSLSRALSLLSVLILSVPTLSVPGLAVNQFLSPTLYPTGVQLGSFNPQQTIGDFNGDGKLDVLLISSSFGTTNISVLPGKEDGSFGTPILTNVAASLSLIKNQPLAVGDFNGDGKLDVAVLAGSVQKIGLLLGNGDGTFTYQLTSNTFSAPISSLATADFNGDGKADIVVGGFTSAGLVASVQVLLANSDGTFQAKTAKTFQLPASSTQTALTLIPGIFKLGGQTDVVVGDSLGTNIFRLSGNGAGTFQSPKTVALGLGSAPGLTAGDFNGDGKLDLAAQGNSFSATAMERSRLPRAPLSTLCPI